MDAEIVILCGFVMLVGNVLINSLLAYWIVEALSKESE